MSGATRRDRDKRRLTGRPIVKLVSSCVVPRQFSAADCPVASLTRGEGMLNSVAHISVLASNRADEPLRVSVLPRRSCRIRPIPTFSHRTVRIAVTIRKLMIMRLIAAIVSIDADDDLRTLWLTNAPTKPSSKRPKGGPSISSNFSIDV
jgi:hypothetical protein